MDIALQTANELFMDYYMILFDSDSDKGEEILVSMLAKQCAIKACLNIINALHINIKMFRVGYYHDIEFYKRVKLILESPDYDYPSNLKTDG